MHSTIVKAAAFVAIICFAFAASAQNDSVYAKRLAEINSPIAIKYTSEAGRYIADFISNPSNTSAALGRYQHYKPSLDSILKLYTVPAELGFYVLGVSQCNTQFAENSSGNSGAWAMPYQVARSYDLKMNTYVDERRDWIKSTTAAARHLQDLNRLYNDWGMALSAFTNSTATMNKYIRVSGTFNYWEMHDSLPYELRQAMPKLVAGMYIYHYHNKHNISVKAYHPVAYDTLSVSKWMSFEKMAPVLHTTINVLQELNPEFKKDIIPLGSTPYLVKLPAKSKPYYSQLDEIEFEPYNMNSYIEVPELEDKNLPIRKSDSASSDSVVKPETKPKPAKEEPEFETIYHKVTSGQSLGIIAQKYGVSVSDIKRWNTIKRNTIYPGQKLKIIRRKKK